MKRIFKQRYPYLSIDTINTLVSESVEFVTMPKGTHLISAGKHHHYFYVMIQGAAKSFYLKEDKRVCIWFALENDIIATIKTFEGEPSHETVELLEDANLIKVHIPSFKKNAQNDITISHLITELITEHALFLEDRFYHTQFMSSKARYQNLLKALPELFQRVSLTDIASFLGVSRETLSRIRAQK